MKRIWKYHFIIIIVAAWLILSVVGFVNKDTVYRAYTIDAKTTPYFALVLEGIRDGVYPWSGEHKPLWEIWEELASEQEEELENILPDTEVIDTSDTAIADNSEIDTEENNQLIDSPYISNGIRSPHVSNRGFVQVDSSYFDDAVFIGDSRTVGLKDYGGLDNAVFYASDGMNVYDLWTEAFCEVDGENVTLEEALSAQDFGKVYFQIGINEMGRGTVDGFMKAYTEAVEKIKELQPDAVIFVQGIMRVTKEKSEKDKIFNNEGINLRNEKIAELADNRTVFYIDMNEAVCDEEGHLDASLTFDDLHLYGSKYGVWVEFLMSHGIW